MNPGILLLLTCDAVVAVVLGYGVWMLFVDDDGEVD